MNTAALLERPGNRQAAHVTAAPARLDAHHLSELDAWIGERRTDGFGQLVLDCSAVEFIDQTAVDAIVSAERDPLRRLRIARPSIAMRITFELLGHAMADEAVAA